MQQKKMWVISVLPTREGTMIGVQRLSSELVKGVWRGGRVHSVDDRRRRTGDDAQDDG
jgi:hypothetical protein